MTLSAEVHTCAICGEKFKQQEVMMRFGGKSVEILGSGLRGGRSRLSPYGLEEHSEWLPSWAVYVGYAYFDEPMGSPYWPRGDPVLMHVDKFQKVRVVQEWVNPPSLTKLIETVKLDMQGPS